MSKRSTSKPRSRLAKPCVVEYLGPNFTEQGTITDLSGDGMKILGTRSVHVGMRFALRLSVGESATPIQIPCAYVRWTRNQEFGVKFGPMEPAVMAQLHDLLLVYQGSPTKQAPENLFSPDRVLSGAASLPLSLLPIESRK